MYQSSKRLITYKEYSCFEYSDFPADSMFTSDVYWDSLGTSILGNSSSAGSNTRSRLPSRLSFRFLWLCLSIQAFLSPLCFCGNDIETSIHCPTYTNERMSLLENNKNVNCGIFLELRDAVVVNYLVLW